MASGNGNKSCRLSATDWERHRLEIQRLYLHENRTLHEVRRLMQLEYNFVARYKISGLQNYGCD